MSKKIVFMVLAGLTLFALVFAGVALAQAPTPRPTPSGPGDRDGVCDFCGTGRGRMGPMMGQRMGGPWDGATLIEVVAKALNMSVQDVTAELAKGKTLRQAIVERNGNPEAIVNEFVNARKAVLDELVRAGRLTQEQANAMLDRIREEATEHLDATGLGCGMGVYGWSERERLERGGVQPRGGMPRGRRAPQAGAGTRA